MDNELYTVDEERNAICGMDCWGVMCFYRDWIKNYTTLAFIRNASTISNDIAAGRMGRNETYNQRTIR